MPGVFLSHPCDSSQPVLYSRFHGGHDWPKTATPTMVSFFQGQALSADPPPPARPITAAAGEVVAGAGGFGAAGDSGPAVAAQLAVPQDVTLDPAGRLFIADTGNQVIRQVGVDGIITTRAG